MVWVAGLLAGALFVVLDVAVNANPLAQRLNAVYAPVARERVNAAAGTAIDLGYGLAIAWVFVLLAPALPGTGGLARGLALGLGIWFFRVVMGVASAWMTHRVPPGLVAYGLVAGLAEMLAIGALVGLLLG